MNSSRSMSGVMIEVSIQFPYVSNQGIGNDNLTTVRKSLPRFSPSQLTSTKILAQRSAVPAVLSRPATSIKRKAGTLSHDEKARLLRIGKRMRKGPLNSYMDPTEFGAGSAILEVSEAVKTSGGYDAWAEDKMEEEIKDGMETVKKVNVKVSVIYLFHGEKDCAEQRSQRPDHPHQRDVIELPAITEPHQGTSYNPPVEAHTELILKAHEVEEKKVKEAERMQEVKERIGRAFVVIRSGEEGVPEGMTVDDAVGGEDVEDGQGGEEAPIAKKMPERKTKQQKAKATRLRAEVGHSTNCSLLPYTEFFPNRNAPSLKNPSKNACYIRSPPPPPNLYAPISFPKRTCMRSARPLKGRNLGRTG